MIDATDTIKLADNLVDELDDSASFLWKSEDYTYGGGRAQIRRKGCNYRPSFSGGASPVFYNDKVYMNYFRPYGHIYDTNRVKYQREECDTTLYPFLEHAPHYAHWLLEAEDVVICVDPYTGKTIWKKVLGKGIYCADDYNKGAAIYGSVAAEGRIFATGSSGAVYCLDAETGETIWESNIGDRYYELEALKEIQKANWKMENETLYSRGGGMIEYFKGENDEGVIVLYNLVALRASDGERLWNKEYTMGSNAHPSKYVEDGVEYIVVGNASGLTDATVRMIEPVSGNELWAYDSVGSNYQSMFLHHDTLVCFVETDRDGRYATGLLGAFTINTSGVTPLWVMDTIAEGDSLYGSELTMRNTTDFYAYHKGYLLARSTSNFMSSDKGIRVIKLATGEVVKEFPTGTETQGSGHMYVADEKLFFAADGNHGGGGDIWIFDITDPANMTVTGYQNSIGYLSSAYERTSVAPLVRGRWFRRQNEGIYAYDFRIPGEAPTVSLTKPQQDTTILHTDMILLEADASDNGSIRKVVFHVNGYPVGETTEAPYQFSWGNETPGEYWINAVAWDDDGNDNSSEVLYVTVEVAPCSAPSGGVTYLSPADESTMNSMIATLKWNWSGDIANMPEGYDVYFGTDPNPPLVANLNHINDTVYSTDTLDMATDYFWRVDARNSCGISEGVVQSFTTTKPAGFRYLRAHFYKTGGGNGSVYQVNWLEKGERVIPNLTSNSSHGMTVTGTGEEGGVAFQAYDGDYDTRYGLLGGVTEWILTLDVGLGNEVLVDSVNIHVRRASGRVPDSVFLEGSYLGLEWYPIGKIYDTWGGPPMGTSLDTSYYDRENQKETQFITFESIPEKKTDDPPFTLEAEASSGLPLTFTSSNTSVATISGDEVTIIGSGTTNITAMQHGNDEYYPASDQTQTLTVNLVSNVEAINKSGASDDLITVYPNPTTGILTIEGGETETTFIYNMLGEVVQVVHRANEADLSALPNGIYIVRINSNRIKVIKK